MENDKHWAAGFIAGEGSFGFYPKHRVVTFALEVHVRDIKVLLFLKEILRCGNVTKSKTRKMARFSVGSKKDLVDLIIPFCDQYLARSYKLDQYKKWRKEVLRYCATGRHVDLHYLSTCKERQGLVS